jgi:hypothetical protein
MPQVKVQIKLDVALQDPERRDGSLPAPRLFTKDSRYVVDAADAAKLLATGRATFLDVPHQEGLPQGTADSNCLARDMRAIEAAANAAPPPSEQPVPLPPEDAASPAKE